VEVHYLLELASVPVEWLARESLGLIYKTAPEVTTAHSWRREGSPLHYLRNVSERFSAPIKVGRNKILKASINLAPNLLIFHS
jgi:hypothetical protein